MSIVGAFMVPHPPMILPEIGRGDEKQIRKTVEAYQEAARMIAALAPETIVLTSPHSVMYADYFHISPGREAHGSFAQFGAGQVRMQVTYDTELRDLICREADDASFPAGTMGERDPALDHATMVPLYFVNDAYEKSGRTPDYRLVRIGLSGLPLTDHYRLGMMIRSAVNALGRRTVFIASGDLSHKLQTYGPYGFAKEGPVYDRRIMETMGSGDFGKLFDFDENFCEKAAECGHRSFVIMAGALDGTAVRAKQLSHEDVTGVGYGICTFLPVTDGEGHTAMDSIGSAQISDRTGTAQAAEPPADESRHFLDRYEAQQRADARGRKASEDRYVALARQSLEYFVKNGRRLPAEDVLRELRQESAGTKQTGSNGGNASYTADPEHKDAAAAADLIGRKAGAFVSIHEDGRLRGCIGTISAVQPTLAEEILHNAVSACSEDPRFSPVRPEELDRLEYSVDVLGPAEKISSPQELDVKRYGVIVTNGYRRGLLLPDLDGVDTVEDQIAIAEKKAGISPVEKVSLERFEVVRHH
jgi:AmmeMemoRadiSam system protein A